MTETVSGDQLVSAMRRAVDCMLGLHDSLNQLDAAMGDGDTGITVQKGAGGVKEFIETNSPGSDIGGFLSKAGMAYNRVAASTMGALICTALMRAGAQAKGKAELDATTIGKMLQAADMGIQERGKAKPGDKTIVDALHPAAEAFASTVASGGDIKQASQAMLFAARRGRDEAAPLRSKVGRAAWVGERTEGKPDPGCVLLVHILEAVVS